MENSICLKSFPSTYLPLALSLILVQTCGQSDARPVVGKVGGDVRLDIGATEVDSDAHIVWSYGPKDKVIISYDDGTCETKLSEKFQLDANGPPTSRSLTANDSGLYEGPSSYSATLTQTSADHSTAGLKATKPNWISWIFPHILTWFLDTIVGAVNRPLAILVCAVVLFIHREKIKEWFRVWYAASDREDPGGSSRQENATQDTAVQATAMQETAV